MDNNTNNWKEFTLGNPQEEKPRRVAKRRRRPLLVLLAVAAVLFFTDFSRQKQNIIPLMLLCLVAFLTAGVCLLVPSVEHQWGLIVLAALSFGLFVACAVCLGGGFFRGLHKYFHIK